MSFYFNKGSDIPSYTEINVISKRETTEKEKKERTEKTIFWKGPKIRGKKNEEELPKA